MSLYLEKQQEHINNLSSGSGDEGLSFTLDGFSTVDIKNFIGCQLLMGIIHLPHERMYFRKHMNNLDPPLVNVMNYNKWKDLKRYISTPNIELGDSKWNYLSTQQSDAHESLKMNYLMNSLEYIVQQVYEAV